MNNGSKSAAQSAGRRKTSPGRPRSPAIDDSILRAAADLFVERGFDAVGIEQVAARAGVARTTVYRRWSSKEAIMAQAIAQDRGDEDERARRRSTSPPAALKSVIAALAEMAGRPRYRKLVARLIGSTPDRPGLMETYLRTSFLPRRKAAAESLERARVAGLIREEADTEILLDLLGGAIIYRLFLRPGDASRADMRGYLRRVLRELRLEAPT